MADFGDSFDRLADTGTWEDIVILFAGFIAGTLLKNTIEGRMDFDAPDEVYGVVVIIASVSFLDGDLQRYGSLGGGLYTVDKLAERLNIKSRVAEGI